MISLRCDVHIHSTSDNVFIRDTDLSCWQYFDKLASKDQEERAYSGDKSSFGEARGQRWFIRNNRPHRLKNALKELNDLLVENSIIFTKWRSNTLFHLILQNLVIISIQLNKFGDISRINFDRFLVGKFPDRPTDILFTEKHLAIVFLETRLTVVSFLKPLNFSKPGYLSQADVRIVDLTLASPSGRRIERKLLSNLDESCLLVWWSLGDQKVYPWAPQLEEVNRANLLVYSSNPELKLLGFNRTRSEPILVRFLSGNSVHYIAQSLSENSPENRIENTVLTLEKNKPMKTKLSRFISVPSHVICHAQIPKSDILLLGTICGTILSFDQVENKLEHQIKIGFIPACLTISSEGAIFFVISEKGLVQCFDIALNHIQLVNLGEGELGGHLLDIGQYFKSPIIIKDGCWSQPINKLQTFSLPMSFTYILVKVLGGPLITIRISSGVLADGPLGPVQIAAQYLKFNLYHHTFLFLSQLSWVHSGDALLKCVTLAFNSLLRQGYSKEMESLVETCLGIYFNPNKTILDEKREEYADNIKDLSRRFCSQLIRHHQLVKGFQLAIDLNDYDLFIDVHHAAKKRGLVDLAQAALIKAEAYYNKYSSEPQSRSASSQSYRSPFQLVTGELMQPGQEAKYLITTAAKKINTNQFRTSDEEYLRESRFRNEHFIPLDYPPTQNAPGNHDGETLSPNLSQMPESQRSIYSMCVQPEHVVKEQISADPTSYCPDATVTRYSTTDSKTPVPELLNPIFRPAFYSSPIPKNNLSFDQQYNQGYDQRYISFTGAINPTGRNLELNQKLNSGSFLPIQAELSSSKISKVPFQPGSEPNLPTGIPGSEPALPTGINFGLNETDESNQPPDNILNSYYHSDERSNEKPGSVIKPHHISVIDNGLNLQKETLNLQPEVGHHLKKNSYYEKEFNQISGPDQNNGKSLKQIGELQPSESVSRSTQSFTPRSSSMITNSQISNPSEPFKVFPGPRLASGSRAPSTSSSNLITGIENLGLGFTIGARIQERETILSSVVQTRTISRSLYPQYIPPPKPSFHPKQSDKEEIKVIHFGVV